jgi:glycosyltransferase involved in cell wall biosynthesis
VTVAVSIGLPVKNGAPLVAEAVRAILQQDFDAFELVIADNASTDDTLACCMQAAGDDPRVRVLRSDHDLGAAANFNRVLRSTEAPLFTWAAHDDRFRAKYLSSCVAALEANPDCSIAIPSIAFIDEGGDVVAEHIESQALASPRPFTRFWCFLARKEWYMLYGVARRERLEATSLFQPEWGTDVSLLWQLLLRHRFAVVPDVLFEYRTYRDKTIGQVMQGLQSDHHRDLADTRYLQLWRRLWWSASDAGLPAGVRAAAKLALVSSLTTSAWRAMLAHDAGVAADRAAAAGRRSRSLALHALVPLLRPSRLVAKATGSRRTG